MQVGDLVRYKKRDNDGTKWWWWTAVVVDRVVINNPYGSPEEFAKVVWQQDTSKFGKIRIDLLEVVNESR